MEATTAVEASSSTKTGTASVSVSAIHVGNSTTPIRMSIGSVAASIWSYRAYGAIPVTTTIPARTTSVITSSVPATVIRSVPVVPGAGTDKDAADEPVGAVIAIRSACIGVVGIVAVSANRRTISHDGWRRSNDRSDADTYYDFSTGSCKRQCQQTEEKK